jgi:hypothetical protein
LWGGVERARTFRHDVAFSFLQQDEARAHQFAAAILPLSSFVYSKEQERLAGTDGMDSFRAAFKDDSRLNVILLRTGWGTTRATRVEETAIKDRCFDEGFGTLLIVKLDRSANLTWCSDHLIYFDIEIYPFEQAVGAIRRQAAQLGADVRPLTGLEKAQREAQAAEYDRETRELLGSDQGVREADRAVTELFDIFERDLLALGQTIPRWAPAFGRSDSRHAVGRLGRCSVEIKWQRSVFNLIQSVLTVVVFDQHIATPQETAANKFYSYFDQPRVLTKLSFSVDRRPGPGICWCEGASKWLTSLEVAGSVLYGLSEAVRQSEK